jgi:small neutral amino acid transporter SnatA (MarC family)
MKKDLMLVDGICLLGNLGIFVFHCILGVLLASLAIQFIADGVKGLMI